jgi:hypothetical protein
MSSRNPGGLAERLTWIGFVLLAVVLVVWGLVLTGRWR